MTIILIFKALFLFLGILFTIVNIMRALGRNKIPPGNTILQAIGITGFIVLQWLL